MFLGDLFPEVRIYVLVSFLFSSDLVVIDISYRDVEE